MTFVCPRCTGSLESRDQAYHCAACRLVFPIVCGIADFRLDPDPYIGIDDDRRKAERLFAYGEHRSFPDLLRHYYDVTPEDPPDLAARWIPRALAEPQIARDLLEEYGVLPSGEGSPPDTAGGGIYGGTGGRLLDVGCSTGGMLVAARGSFGALVGVDVALRWLAVGRIRLRDAGVDATLVAANAEHLPFPGGSFAVVTCTDTLEHVRDAGAALGEMRRVSARGARLLATANNRWTPLPEPNIHLWGVPQLPRAWQARYVRWRRRDLHPYRIFLRSARAWGRMAERAGFTDVRVDAGAIRAPHAGIRVRRALASYDRLRSARVIAPLLRAVGPKLVLTAGATASRPPSL